MARGNVLEREPRVRRGVLMRIRGSTGEKWSHGCGTKADGKAGDGMAHSVEKRGIGGGNQTVASGLGEDVQLRRSVLGTNYCSGQ